MMKMKDGSMDEREIHEKEEKRVKYKDEGGRESRGVRGWEEDESKRRRDEGGEDMKINKPRVEDRRMGGGEMEGRMFGERGE